MANVKILLVENDTIEAMDIKSTLESFGYSVIYMANRWEEAVEEASKLMPDLILIDIVLDKEHNGIEAVSEIKKLNLPVIYLATPSDEPNIQKTELTDPYGYILKPYDPIELKYAIKLALYKNKMEKELKITQKALKKSADDFRHFIDDAPVAIAMFDSQMRYIAASSRWIEDYNLNGLELVGKSHYDVFPEITDELKEVHKRALAGSILSADDDEFVRADGSIQYIRWEVHPWYLSSGDIGGIIIFSEDVTERKLAENALKESEEKYRLISENTADFIWIFDPYLLRFTYVSPSVYNLVGYTPEEVLKKPINEFMTPESYQYILKNQEKAIKAIISGDNSYKVQYNRIDQVHKDGSIVPTEVVTNFILNDEGQVSKIIGVSRDITEREKAEEVLIESENRFRNLVENVQDIFVRYNLDLRYQYVSPNIEEFTGKKAEYYIGKSHLEAGFPPEMAEFFDKHLLISIDSKKPVDVNFSIQGPQGLIFAETRVYPEFDHQGHVKSVVTVTRDVTKSKKAEELLRENEEKYRALFESNPDYTILVGLNGIILDVNSAAVKFTNLSKEELIEKNYTELEIFPQKDLPHLMEKFIQVLKGEIVEPFQYRIINKEGSYSWVETQLVPLMRDGKVYSITVIANDITVRKTATEQLKSSLKEKEVLLKEIHHRVRNNLQIISSLLYLQKQSVESDEFADILMESQNRIKSITMVHEKLYDSDDLTRINFPEYIERLVSDLFNSYSTSTRQVAKVIDVENLRLNIETAVPCGLIISELVSNSLKHAFPEGRTGTLIVSLKTGDEWNELVISDDGVGFPEEFDFRNTKTLGLKLVNTLVNQINGEITLDRSRGTEFKIIFKELKYKERI